MTEDEIRAAVTETALEVFELEPDEVEGDTSLEGELHVDSLQKLEFITALEKRFGVRYNASEGSHLDTVDSAVRITQERL